jgi:ketosteroid isomerase-like protein
MKKFQLYIPLVIFLFLAFGCRKEDDDALASLRMTEENKAEVAASIEETFSNYVEATLKMDWEPTLQIYLDSDKLVFAANGSVIIGKISFVEAMNQLTNTIKEFNALEIIKKYIYVLSRNSAVLTIEFNESYISISDDLIHTHGSFIYVFQRIDGEWKIVHAGGTHIPITE